MHAYIYVATYCVYLLDNKFTLFCVMQIMNGYLKLLANSNQSIIVIISQTMTSIVNRVAVTQQFHLLSKVTKHM